MDVKAKADIMRHGREARDMGREREREAKTDIMSVK